MSNFAIATLLLLSGCSGGVDVVSATDTGEPMAPVTTSAPAEVTAALPPVNVSGFVHDADGAPLSDVTACLQASATIGMDIGACTTSGSDGSWTIRGVPASMLVTIGLSKQGFVPALRAIQTETADIQIPEDEGRLLPESVPPMFAGAALAPRTGGIEFFVGSKSGSDVRASVTVFSFDSRSHDAVYMGADGTPAQGATSGSFGGITNLASGLYVLTFTVEGGACTTRGGLYGYPYNVHDQPGRTNIIVPVTAGYVTTPVGVDCTGPAAPIAP